MAPSNRKPPRFKYFRRRKQTESLDEVDRESLIYSPPQDQDIYDAEKRQLLFRALGDLSEQERLLYHLWLYLSMTLSR